MRRNSLLPTALLTAGLVLLATAVSHATVTIKGKNETVQIKLPDGWKESGPPPNLPPSTELCAAQPRIGAFLIVNVDEATDDTPTLDDYLKASLKEMTKTYGDLVATKPVTGKINKQETMRCEARYTFEGTKVGAVVSVVKVDTHYERVTILTGVDQFNRVKSALANLANDLSDITVPVGPDVTFKGKDSLFQLTFTGDWKQQPLPLDAPSRQLIARSFKQNMEMEVFSIVKADTTETLQHLFDASVDELSKQMTDATKTDPEKIKLAGFDALRCEATGSFKDAKGADSPKITFLITVLSTPTQLVIIDESSPQKDYPRLKAALLKPLNTFKELTVTAKANPDADGDEPILGKLTPIRNKDGTIQIGLPHGWKSTPPPPDADKSLQITASSPQDGTEVMVVVEDRKTITLQQYTDGTLKAFGADPGVTDLTHTDPKIIKINGKDAAQFEIHCTANGTKLAYLVTIAQTNKSYLRTQFYSTESKFTKMKPIFLQLAPGVKQGAVDDNSDDQ